LLNLKNVFHRLEQNTTHSLRSSSMLQDSLILVSVLAKPC